MMNLLMIDTEIIVYKRRLERARTRPMTDKAIDAIQHLEWIRNVIVSIHRRGFNDIMFYLDELTYYKYLTYQKES